jgi:2'-5' RNA ligase
MDKTPEPTEYVEQDSTPLRLFIAVATPPAVRAAAGVVIDRLRGRGEVRWTPPERLHLTLKFLGATSAEKVPLLTEILAERANTFSRFVVELGDVGAFPSLRKPQTVWLGVEQAEELTRLAEEIDQAAQKLGFEREARAYRAHLTLGRVKSPRDLGALAEALRASVENPDRIEWPVDEVELIRSELRPEGPLYTILHRFPLRRSE